MIRTSISLRTGAVLVLTLSLTAAAIALTQPEKPSQPPKPATPPAAKPDAPQPAKPDPAKGAAPKNDADEAAAMASMNPGPVNEKLQKLAGQWDTVTRLEMAGRDPAESKGAETIAGALGGRFLQETGTGQMAGMPTQSFKMWGYNNGSRKYEAVWSWTMSTGFLHMAGESKDDGKTIDWKAWFDNEIGVREEFKCLTTFTDADHFTVKIYGGTMPDGDPAPTMTTIYSRKK